MSRQLKRVLVVEPNSEIWEIIEENLDEVCANKTYEVFPLRKVKNRHEADIVITDPEQPSFDLAIINTDIPDERNRPSKEEGGLELVKSWRDRQIKVPVIFIASDHNLYPEINALDNTELVLLGEKFDQKLQEQSKLWLEHKIQPKEKKFELCITLDLDNNSEWEIHGLNFALDTKDHLSISSKTLQELKLISTKLSKWVDRVRISSEDPFIRNHWQEELRDLGEKLWEQIFNHNHSWLCWNFPLLCGACHGMEKAQICFTVKDDAYPIMLEALAEKNQGFIMLKAPIYRQLIMPGVNALEQQYPLFHPKSKTRDCPLNCLIIETGTEKDFCHNLGIELEKLHNVTKEANFLESYLSDNKDRLNIGNVKRISASSEKYTCKEQVQNALHQGEWHIIHYAGHSYSYYDEDEQQNKGYIFFPGREGAKEVEMQEFAGWLLKTKTRFVYLSSCHSSEEDFVFNLVNKKVPAVLGFRWDLDDDKAAEYTQNFYESLFNLKSLEYAFLEAKKFMYQNYQDNPIWASPILMMQIPV